MNELQSKIKTVTRRMMSMVSELSMHQAEGVKLQQEVRERESELEMCYRRMEKGEPPNVTIEREWLCLVRDTEAKARDKDIARQVGTAAGHGNGQGHRVTFTWCNVACCANLCQQYCYGYYCIFYIVPLMF